MSTTTPKYGFKKIGQDEFYNVDDQNSNWDAAEQALVNIENEVNSITVPNQPGDIGAVPTSRKINNKNLTSDIVLSASDIKAEDGSTLESFKTSTNSSLAEKAAQTDLTTLTSTVSNNQYKQSIKNIYGVML